MTNHSVSPPAGWSPAPGGELDVVKVYVYDVSDSKRILVGLHSQSEGDTGALQLRALTIEETPSVHRHDFVVAEHLQEQGWKLVGSSLSTSQRILG